MKIVVKRGCVVPFEELPLKSVALDGYVQGPALDPKTERYSFDHHDKCVRLVTSATCKQVLDALLLGLDPDDYTIFVNDVDEDTVLSVWLLENRHRMHEPKVRWLVDRASERDAHGPAFPIQDTESQFFRRFSEAVNAPVRDHQEAGTLHTADLAILLRECVDVIGRVLDAPDVSTPIYQPERSYRIVRTGRGGWILVESNEKVADLLYAAGHTRFIVYRQQPDGSFNYTIMKKSDLVPGFPVGPTSDEDSILHMLSRAEAGWGGGSTIGGAPRQENGRRSELSPNQVFDLVETLLEGQNS